MEYRRNKIFSLLLIVFTISLAINSQAADKKVIHEKTFAVEKGELLEVNAQGGDVGVKAWDKNEVYIKVVGTSKAAKKVKFQFEKTDEGVYVEAEKKSSGWFNWGGLQYRILVRVPESFNVKVKTSGGDVRVISVNGQCDVKTSGGDITVSELKGELNFKTSGGDIESSGSEGKVSAATSGGDINIRKHAGDVWAATSGGDIAINNTGGKIDASTSGGDIVIKYSGENKGISGKTSGGDIKLLLSEGINADVSFKTTGGDVDVEYPNAHAEEVKAYKYTGTFNNGGEKIILKTTGGDITVRAK